MKIFVTGGTGLVGSHVVDRLTSEGHEVLALVRKSSDTRHLRERGATLVVGDVTDPASLERALSGAGVAAVVHAAAVVLSADGEWAHYEAVGVRGTENVVRAMHAAGVRRLVHISSTAVYGMGATKEPLTEDQPVMHDAPRWNHYVREKVLAEDVVWAAHAQGQVAATALRPGVIFGLRDRNVTPGVLGNMAHPKGALIGDGRNVVSHVAVQDVASAVSLALANPVSVGRCYNLVDPARRSQLELYQVFSEVAGAKVPAARVPMFMAIMLGRAFNWLHRVRRRPGPVPADPISVTVWGSDGPIDSSRATAELGWRAEVDLRQSVAESVQWHRAQTGRGTASAPLPPDGAVGAV